jgi:hypothetical protein
MARIRAARGSERVSPACCGGVGTDLSERPKVKMPKRSMKQAYDDVATMKERRWIPEKYKV